MKKRLLTLLIVMIMAVLALSACDVFFEPIPPSEYTVTFETNGANPISPVVVRRGGLLDRPADPERGYDIFDGWYSDKELTTPWDFENNKVNSALTLYAKWIDHVHIGGTATCTAKPICDVCGEEYGKTKEHVVARDAAVEPTCTTTGLTEGAHCDVCGEVLKAQETVPVAPHTPEVIPAVNSTCTETGLTEGSKCSVCGEILTPQTESPVKEHTYDDEYDANCNDCGFEREVPCRHAETIVIPGKAATCTEPGLTDGKKCADEECGAIVVEQEVIDPIGHAWGDWTETKAPNYVEAGEKTRECSVCGEDETVVVDKLVGITWYFAGSMNNWGESTDVLTYDKDGNASIEMKLNTGDEFKIADIHSTNWSVQLNSSNLPEGTAHFGDKDGNIVALATGTFKFTVSLDKKLTIEVISLDKPVDLYFAGSRSNGAWGESTELLEYDENGNAWIIREVIVEEEFKIAAIKNNWRPEYGFDSLSDKVNFGQGEGSNIKVLVAGTYKFIITSECKLVIEKVHVCDYTEEVTKTPTCTDTGVKTFTCECGDSYTEVIPVNENAHDYVGTITTEPTCESAGVKTFTCAHNPDHTYTETVDKLGHKDENDDHWCDRCKKSLCGENHTWVEADCENPKTCSSCGAVEGKKLGHDYEPIVTNPTCVTDGYITYVCKNDNSHTYREAGEAATGHSGEWTETLAPTYDTVGEEERTCAVCGTVETREVPKIVRTHDIYFVGTINNWSTTYEDEALRLTESADRTTWTGTLTVTENASIKLYNIAPEFDGERWIGNGYDNINLLPGTHVVTYTVATGTVAVESDLVTKKLYLEAGVWDVANAWFVIHAWNTHGDNRIVMEATETNGLYVADFPVGYTGIVFCRMNANSTEFDWNNVWNQTVDITAEEGVDLYSINGWGTESTGWKSLVTGSTYVPHTHNYTEEVTKTPTCTETGVKTFTCECGDSYTEVIPVNANAHTWGEGSVTKAATCSAVGEMTYTCEHDSTHTKTEDIAINADAHDWDEGEVTTEPTCTVAGVKTFTCKHNASHTYEEPVKALDHKDDDKNNKCDKCEAVLCGEGNHVEGEGEVTLVPTCVEKGTMTYKCSACGTVVRTEDIEVDENNHDLEHHDAKAPTCEEIGWDAYVTCKREGCNHTTYNEKTALEHDIENHEAQDPTCENVGWDAYETCKREGCDYTTYNEIPALNHDWDEGVILIPATHITKGTTRYTCKNDNTHVNDVEDIPYTFTVYFKNTDNWSNVSLYCYGPSEFTGAWPGTKINRIEGSANWYHYTNTSNTPLTGLMIIFNNGGAGIQTANLKYDSERIYWIQDSYGSQNSYVSMEDAQTLYFRSSENSWGTDNKLVENNDGSFTVTLELKAGEEFKIANEDWKLAYGYSHLKSKTGFSNSGGNVKVNTAGTYVLTLTADGKIDAHRHSYSSKITTSATCVAEGVMTFTCTCGNSYTEVIPVKENAHTWDEGTETKPATCSAVGEMTYTCEHDSTHTKTADIPKLAHTEVVDKAVEATCTTAGKTEGKHCDVCKEVLVKQEETAKLGHTFTKYVSNGDATCTTDGTKTAKCERCNETDTKADVGSQLDHTEIVDDAKAATCTATGLTEGKHCSACGEVLVKQEETAKLGHAFTNYVSNGDATCTTDGTQTAKCERCNETDTKADVGSQLGHTFTKYVSNGDATCTADGTKTAKCDRCDEKDTKTDVGSQLGHTGGTADCEKKAVCTRCGENYGEIGDHSYGEWIVVIPATCKATGTLGHYTCSVCKKNFDADKNVLESLVIVIDPNAHFDGDDENNNCDYCMASLCTEHNWNEGEVITEATCENTGSKKFTCTACGTTETRDTDALGHNYSNEWTVDKAATCTEAGSKSHHCSRCDSKSDVTEIPAKGHRFSSVVTTSATCTANGYITITCGDCNSVFVSGVNAEADQYLVDHPYFNLTMKEHVDSDKDHLCDYGCGMAFGEHTDADKDHDCDYGCSVAIGTCEDADKDHDCDYGCSVAIGTCEDADKDHDCDYGCDKYYGEHADSNKDHVCDYGCSVAIGTCEDADKDHKCDYGCDETFGEHVAAENSHNCGYCGQEVTECADGNNDHNCDVCGEKISEHDYVGGLCSVCKEVDSETAITVYFQNNWKWSDVHVYYWINTNDGEIHNADWPGEAIQKVEGMIDEYGNEHYIIVLPYGATGFIVNGIKNDGSGKEDQTPNIINDGIENCTVYYMHWDNGNTVKTFDGHAWDNGVITTAPTCESTGVKTFTCATCGDTKEETVDAEDHSWSAWETTVEPTEKTEGKEERSCSKCSKTESNVLPVLTHTHSHSAVVTDPTCVTEGYTTHTCSCGDSYTDSVVPATGKHIYASDNSECETCERRKVTVYYKNINNWSQVNTWIWAEGGSDYTGGSWPGAKMTKNTSTGWYYYSFETDTTNNLKIIFSNNGNNQTANLSLNIDKVYWMSAKKAYTKAEIENTMFLNPEYNWVQNNERYSAYFFNDSTGKNQWVSMTDSDGDGIFEAKIPTGTWEKVIFVRMSKNTTDNNWNNKWDQTANLDLSYGKVYTINSNNHTGVWK